VLRCIPELDLQLALVALVLRKHLKDVTLLELPHGIRIRVPALCICVMRASISRFKIQPR